MPRVKGSSQSSGEGPRVVVDRSAAGVVVFWFPAEFLGEFADQAAPQGEVVTGVPRLVADRLEDTDRQDLIQACGVTDGGAVAAMQRKRRRAGRRVVSEGEGAEGDVDRAASRVAGVADRAVISPSVTAVYSCAAASPMSIPSK